MFVFKLYIYIRVSVISRRKKNICYRKLISSCSTSMNRSIIPLVYPSRIQDPLILLRTRISFLRSLSGSFDRPRRTSFLVVFNPFIFLLNLVSFNSFFTLYVRKRKDLPRVLASTDPLHLGLESGHTYHLP